MPIPEKIKNAPELFLGLQLFFQAFMELTTERGQGFGSAGSIGWFSIQRYCDVYGIVGEQREDLLYHVLAMDEVYLKISSGKRVS